MGRFRQAFDTVKTTYREWQEDDAQTWAASVAFYSIFSLAPLLVLAVAIAGLVFGERAAQGELTTQLEGVIGPEGAQVAETAIANAGAPGGGGILATIVSLALLLLGASKVFSELQKAMNRIWDVRKDPDAGIKEAIRKRMVGFAMVLGVGLMLLVALVASAVIGALGQLVQQVPGGTAVWQVVDIALFVGVFTLLFAALFKYVPDVDIDWSDVWFGAFVTAVLFTVGKWALGIYLSSGSMGSAYGAASSLVILLAWIFYSAQIFFIGAEYTQVHAERKGRHLQPDQHAVRDTATA